jgi:hypothetical protein
VDQTGSVLLDGVLAVRLRQRDRVAARRKRAKMAQDGAQRFFMRGCPLLNTLYSKYYATFKL